MRSPFISRIAVCLAGLTFFAAATAQTLTVWDWKSSDPVTSTYFQKVKKDFEASHPGVTVKFVGQPIEQYYTILGTSLSANAGPDVFLMNGGAQARARMSDLVDLSGLDKGTLGVKEFQDASGKTYALPLTLQGFVVYYNKALYTQVGLDPNKPPKNWDDLKRVCAAFKAKGGKIPCIALGNKEGYGAEFFFSSLAATSMTPDEQAQFAAGKLKWSSPQVKGILQAWVDTQKDGWYPKGANSTTKFMDEYEQFMRGDAGNTIGLISDVAHWKQFENFLTPEKLGVYKMPSPTVAAGNPPDNPRVPVSGGIGYGVNKASKNVALARQLVQELASPAALQVFANDAGALPANSSVDLASFKGPTVKIILGWLKDSAVTTTLLGASAAEMEEWHRQSQLLLNGDTTVDKAAARMDEVQASAKR
ncbi:extracellular solute-binding protein [Paraburkholderia sp. MMS20-SJTN17]|uniref:Extracellular solute-binding protein n=1 Tax=Paraburkholderia translucens TaxID=2886945 RepID=A0ABS8KKE0_9BURK|nr:extracellular solute-binding protein [Paraburkholderia sp. MMS20-SJTN17]MCC8405243.1 extracellular solute-binding protein [Paraburkholderia sp. MMS20-SJTN17]